MPQRKTSWFDDLVLAPWPVGAAMGLVVLLVGNWIVPALLASSNNPYFASVGEQLTTGVLSPLMWVVAIACWASAAVSALRQAKRRKLVDSRADVDSLRNMSWRELEQLVLEAYRRLGYQVEESVSGGPDGGVDLRLRRHGQLTLVQCKHWRSRRVGAPVVREQYGLLAHHTADAVIVVTTGDFTSEARAFAAGKPIELIAGTELLPLVRGVQRTPAPPTDTSSHAATVVTIGSIACPKCASPMVQRTSRQTGAEFFGCSRFPACRGTRSL